MAKVDFLICGKRAFDTLQHHVKLHGAISVNQVVSYADKDVLNDPYDELISFCRTHGITFIKRQDYESSGESYRIVMGWQRMLVSDNNTITLHDSILPRYRGFAPLVNSLCNGEREIGVTAFLATEEYDKGPIIVQKRKEIEYPLTIEQAMEIITPLYFEVCNYVFEAIQLNAFHYTPQNDDKASYSLWRDELDYHVDWNETATAIRRFVDAVGFPYGGAVARCNGEWISIKSVHEEPDVVIENRTPGKVIFIKDGQPVVVCGKGLLRIAVAHTARHESLIPFTKFRSRFQ